MNSIDLSNRSAVNIPVGRACQFTGRMRWLFLLIVLSLCTFQSFSQGHILQGNADNTLYVDDLYHDLSYTGSYRDFTIPAGTEGKSLYLFAKGGDGGTISYKSDLTSGKGGQGATVSGYFTIGSGPNEIPVGSIVRVIVGSKGESYQNHGQTSNHCAGGGGGTGVLFLPSGFAPATADPENWHILVVAGGGGGGFAKWGMPSLNGDPGNNEKLGTGYNYGHGIDGDSQFFSTNFSGWGGDIGGGGGTTYLRYEYFCSNATRPKSIGGYSQDADTDDQADQAAEGGFKEGTNGKLQPLGGSGGRARLGGNHGGFGFGGGGYGGNLTPGGGGGYAGGDHGSTVTITTSMKKAGGGGSYVNPAYAQRPSKIKHGVIENPTNGAVAYNISDMPASIPLLSVFHAPETVLESGDFALALMQSGELTLFERMDSGFRTVWRSDTATPATSSGTVLEFTDNGDLQLLDKNAQLVWHTNTADRGNKLVLESTGKLYIVDAHDAVIWSVN